MRERGWVAGRYLTRAGSAPPPGAGPVTIVTGVPTNDVLNVRAGPGTNYRIVGALGNGSQVRNLGCQTQGASRWCRIEMTTDMRERGWVNARYLAGQGGQASQLPSASRVQRIRLLGEVGAQQVYRGQLWQSGDHKIEITNRSDRLRAFNVLVSIR